MNIYSIEIKKFLATSDDRAMKMDAMGSFKTGMDEKVETEKEGGYYDKNTSFFDRISCEALETKDP